MPPPPQLGERTRFGHVQYEGYAVVAQAEHPSVGLPEAVVVDANEAAMPSVMAHLMVEVSPDTPRPTRPPALPFPLTHHPSRSPSTHSHSPAIGTTTIH